MAALCAGLPVTNGQTDRHRRCIKPRLLRRAWALSSLMIIIILDANDQTLGQNLDRCERTAINEHPVWSPNFPDTGLRKTGTGPANRDWWWSACANRTSLLFDYFFYKLRTAKVSYTVLRITRYRVANSDAKFFDYSHWNARLID